MAKKVKNSVKTEMKNMVQKELAKIMAKQISNEDFFKEMVKDVVNDFYEEDVELKEVKDFIERPWDRIQNNKLGHLKDILNGKYKENFNDLVNDKNKSKGDFLEFMTSKVHKSPTFPESKVNLKQSDLESLFNAPKESNIFNKAIFSVPNSQNLTILKGINAEQALSDYKTIQFTDDTLGDIFNNIAKYRKNLECSHEQTHSNKNSIEVYRIKNKEEVEVEKGKYVWENINPNYFAFDLKIKTKENTQLREISLGNVFLNGNIIAEGNLGFENAEKMLNLVVEIYSDTTIEPISKTESINVAAEIKPKKEKTNLKRKVSAIKTKK